MGDLPTRLRIGPLAYDVTDEVEAFHRHGINPNEHFGYTHHETATILIHPSTAPQMRRITLLHEVMHAVAFAAGAIDTRKRKEEAWVVMVSPMLVVTLRANPELVAFLLDDGETPKPLAADPLGDVAASWANQAGQGC